MSEPRPAGVDTTVAHNARVWNYWLGGKDNYAADREVGGAVRGMFPSIGELARADRAFLGRVVRFLAGEAGIRQFLDIGTGLPTASNTHEVAQGIARECRVVYVDNDPLVLVHARALLTGTPEGATQYVEADAHDPEAILRAAGETLDFDRPVAVMLLGILNFIQDTVQARRVAAELVRAVPSGSYVALSHPTSEVGGQAAADAIRFWNENGTPPMTARTIEQIRGFLDGLEILEPGVVSCTRWRAGDVDLGAAAEVAQYGAVARKP